MIYDIRQTARYDYAASVPFAKHCLRLVPLAGGNQRNTAVSIKVEPRPSRQADMPDFFGNATRIIDVDTPHQAFSVTMTARTRVDPPMPIMTELTPDWQELAARALASPELAALAPAHFLFASRAVPIEPEIGHYATASFAGRRPVLEAACDLMARIHADFAYEPGTTEVTTPPLEAFHLRSGVCQDFAHVMISGLRWLGLPAGYVSGYLRTVPPPGQPRLQGVDAMHAWVMLWCGEEIGWVGLDPTNDTLTAEEHIIVARGRDYADVAPIEGVLYGPGRQEIETGVDVVPVG